MPHFTWYCGWCGFGQLSYSSDSACCRCHRRIDGHRTSRVEHIGPCPRSYHQAALNLGVRSFNTESVRSRAASPAKPSVNRSPANSLSSKDSNAAIDAGNGNSGLAPNALIPPTVRSNLNKSNVSQTGSIDKQSRLNSYLSVNPEDPWNQEWVVYAARTPLPGEASYLLETGEPATIPRRRRYDRRRRTEVAFTRNNGGACDRCRRRHQACPHRLQERLQVLAAAIEGNETASEQLRERGVTQRATDAVHSGVATGIGSSSQRGEATSHDSSAARGRLSFPTPRREPSQRPPAHGRPSARPSERLPLAPSQSQRRQASQSSSALVDEPVIRPGRLPVHGGSDFLRPPLARRSAWDGHGINAVNGSSGSSRHPNYITIHDTSQDSAASIPVVERYSLGSTQRGTERLAYMSDGVGLQSFPPLPYNEQQSPLSEQMFATQPDTFDPASNQRTTLPYEGFQQAMPNFSDEILGWQIDDGSLFDAGPSEEIFDTALLDDLPAAPDPGGDHDATQLPSAIDATDNSQPAGSDEWIDIDPAADFALDNLYYGAVDPSVDPPLESYAAYLGNPIFTDGQESTSGSNKDPIPTPPSDGTG